MSLEDRKEWLEARRARPGKILDGSPVPGRGGRYGEHAVLMYGKPRINLSEEGSYYVAVNPTPGTGVAGHAAPTDISVVTKPHVFIRNDSSASDDLWIYLDYVRLQVTAAGAGATTALYAMELDTATTRYSSGGTELTETSPSMQTTVGTTAKIYHGAVTAGSASSSAREIGSGVLRTVVPVVGDTYLFDFGGDPQMQNMIVAGTAIANIRVPAPPVVLGPTDQFLLHLAGASQSGAHSYEITVGYWVR